MDAVLLLLCTKYIIALLFINFIFTVYKLHINKNSSSSSSTISACHHRHHSGNDVDTEKPMMLNLIMAIRLIIQINPPMSRDLSGGGRSHGCDVRSRGVSNAPRYNYHLPGRHGSV